MAENKIPHVIIEVRGGMVQRVFADCAVDVDVFDFDTDDPERYDETEEAWCETFNEENEEKYYLVW